MKRILFYPLFLSAATAMNKAFLWLIDNISFAQGVGLGITALSALIIYTVKTSNK